MFFSATGAHGYVESIIGINSSLIMIVQIKQNFIGPKISRDNKENVLITSLQYDLANQVIRTSPE